MLSKDFTEDELKTAVIEYVDNWVCAIPEEGADHVFSVRYEDNKKQILLAAGKTKKRGVRLQRIICTVLVCMLCLVIVIIISPFVRTSIRNWVINIHDTVFTPEDDDMMKNSLEIGKPEENKETDSLGNVERNEADYSYFDVPASNLHRIELPVNSITLINNESVFEKHFPVPDKNSVQLYESYTQYFQKYLNDNWFKSHQLLVIVLPSANGGAGFRRVISNIEGTPKNIVEIEQYYTSEYIEYYSTEFVYFVELDKVFKEGAEIKLVINNIKLTSQ